MYFLHAPKLVLTGSSSSLRDIGDRATALGAEVVVVEPEPARVVDDAPAVVELDGFDVAVVSIARSCGACADLACAAALLARGLRAGALVIVSSPASAERSGRRFAAELADRSGLALGRQFDVVGLEGDDVTWSTRDEGAQIARYLVDRLGAGAPVMQG
jgi:hypothetical protein